jgi:circadian clock protein KaiC
MHLATMHKAIDEFQPAVVVIDPISTFSTRSSDDDDVKSMLTRLIDLLKGRDITVVLIDLTTAGQALEHTGSQISSLIDTWLLVRDIELIGERNRALYVLKSRGMAHSNQLREFLLTNDGIELKEAYLGESGALTGSARLAREARDAADRVRATQEVARQQAGLQRKCTQLKAQIAALQEELEATKQEATASLGQDQERMDRQDADRDAMERSRHSDAVRRDRPNGQGAHR